MQCWVLIAEGNGRREVSVLITSTVVAGGGSTGSGLRLASGISLGRVGISSVSLRSVMVAVGEREGGAEVGSEEGVRGGVGRVLEALRSGDDSLVLEEFPRGVELSAVAA